MNMISTGAFLNEMDASNKQPTVAEKFAAVWEKKNAKAARAGGVSLMALSLAACGSSSTTTTTTTSDTTTTTVTPTTTALTVGVDSVTGTSGDDTITGARVDDVITLNAADVIDGGAGTDTLTARTVNGLATSSISNVENFTVTETGTGGDAIVFTTATANYITGVSHITNLASSNNLTFTRVSELAELTVNNVTTTTTLQFADSVLSGAADTMTLNLIGAGAAVTVGTATDADGDYETLVINASGSASDMGAGNGLGADATTVTVNASAALDLGSTAAFNKVTTFNAAASTAGVTAVFEDFDSGDTNGTAITTTKTLTGGAGADSFDISAMEVADVGVMTVSMGAGNDTVTANAAVAGDITINGGDGSDTLVVTAALTATTAANISNFEVLSLNGDVAQNLALLSGNTLTNVILDGDGAQTNAADSVTTLTVRAAHDGVSSFARLIDGSANSLNIVVDEATTSATSMTASDEETITITANNAYTLSTGLTGADLVTLNITGDSTVDLSAVAAAKLATIDASGLTAAAQLIMSSTTSTANMTVTGNTAASGYTGLLNIATGTGDDTITGTVNADTINGGAGSDTINAGGGADQITGGAGADTINLGSDAAADDVFLTVNTSMDTITGFDTTEDDLNMTNMVAAQNAAVAVTSSAADTDATFVDNNTYVISDGSTANGSNNAAGAIASYTDLTDVAAYLSTLIDSDLHGGADGNTAAGDEAVFVINDLVGDKTYVYHFLENGTATDTSAGAAVSASELALIATITEESGSALVVGDIV